MSSPNQKIIRIGKKNEPKKGDNNYICVFKDVYFEAYRNLSPTGIGLWMYLYGNKSGFQLELSEKAFCAETGKNKSTYYSAVKELIEKGYLIETSSNHYTYYAVTRGNEE